MRDKPLRQTLENTRDQMKQARRDIFDDGQSATMQEIDSLIGVAKDETERMLKAQGTGLAGKVGAEPTSSDAHRT